MLSNNISTDLTQNVFGGGRTAISIRNAAKVDTSGHEVEVTYLPTDHLMLSAAVVFLDATLMIYPVLTV